MESDKKTSAAENEEIPGLVFGYIADQDFGRRSHLSTWLSVPVALDVTMVNISVENMGGAACRCVIGGGRELPFATNAFDIVFSNSVIEHSVAVES